MSIILNGDTGVTAPEFDTPVFNSSNGQSYRNKIIGGDFTINPWQRGTSFAALSAAVVNYTADRFNYFQTAAGGVVSILKTTDAPTVAQAGLFTQHCLHVDVTTADTSIAVTEIHQVVQLIEGLNAASFGFGQAGTRNVTLSFWHKHTKTGVHCISIRNSTSDRSYVVEYTQDVTDTWEKATITIPVDTSGTWLYDTGIGLRLAFALSAGTNFQTTANTWQTGNFIATVNQVNNLDNVANNFKIALVQLEAGSTATAFETRDVGTELALCQRYYWRIGRNGVNSNIRIGNGYAVNTTTARITGSHPAIMRSNVAALEQSGTAGDYGVAFLAGTQTSTSVPTFVVGNYSTFTIDFVGGATLTAGQGLAGFLSNLGNGYLGFSAEL
jgi:hypothetical protein